MKIQVTKKSQYGRERVFPVDDKAQVFCALVEKATLSPAALGMIEMLGFEIEYVPDTLPSMDQALPPLKLD